MSAQPFAFSIDLSTADSMDRAERTLRHALAAVHISQVNMQLISGLCTVQEAVSSLVGGLSHVAPLQVGDIDPLCGLRVLDPAALEQDMENSFKQWEALLTDPDTDIEGWEPVRHLGKEGPHRVKVSHNGTIHFVHDTNLREVKSRVLKQEPEDAYDAADNLGPMLWEAIVPGTEGSANEWVRVHKLDMVDRVLVKVTDGQRTFVVPESEMRRHIKRAKRLPPLQNAEYLDPMSGNPPAWIPCVVTHKHVDGRVNIRLANGTLVESVPQVHVRVSI